MISVVLPGALQPLAGGLRSIGIELNGASVADLLGELAVQHPALVRRIRDEQGGLRRFVNVYVDGADVRHQGGLAAAVPPDAEVLIMPSVAGG